ncbi:hypothetical protein SAMN04488689_12013 [Paenibacillus sp. cl6col]|nr:hypothetical protein SAMN04488689_12013 [Paenibacillus sp. cl6col]
MREIPSWLTVLIRLLSSQCSDGLGFLHHMEPLRYPYYDKCVADKWSLAQPLASLMS